jgi:peptidyl-prolyl cis-trans isomerase C
MLSIKPAFAIAAVVMFASLSLLMKPTKSYAQAKNVILKSDKVEVTEEMLEAALDAMPPDARNIVESQPKKIAEFLKTLLTNKTLVKEAQDSKLDQSPVVKAEIAAARESIIARARLREFDLEIVTPNFANQAREIFITDAEKYTIAPEIDTSHILFKLQCRTEKEALRLAVELRAKIIAGAAFEAAAIEYSEDGSVKKNKGNLGNKPADTFAKEYSVAALALKIDEISQPILSEFGVHLIRLNKFKPGKKITFEEAQSSIVATLEAKYKSEQRRKKINLIELDPTLVLNTELLDLRRQRAQQPTKTEPLQSGAPLSQGGK